MSLWFGDRKTQSYIPGTTCELSNDQDSRVLTWTNAWGEAWISYRIPASTTLIGTHIYSQYVIADALANRAGATSTNGVGILVGGQR